MILLVEIIGDSNCSEINVLLVSSKQHDMNYFCDLSFCETVLEIR